MAIITNQLPFGMHFEIHLCCHSSPFLFFLIETRFPLVLKDKPNFDLSICKIIQLIDVISTTFILACIQNVYHNIFLKVHKFIYMQLKLGTIPLIMQTLLHFKKEVMSSFKVSYIFFQSIVESFYRFLAWSKSNLFTQETFHMITFLLN